MILMKILKWPFTQYLLLFFISIGFVTWLTLPKEASIEDCTNYNYINTYITFPKDFFHYKIKIRLEENEYKQMWMDCEIEKKKFPEMFAEKYDGTRKDTMEKIEGLNKLQK